MQELSGKCQVVFSFICGRTEAVATVRNGADALYLPDGKIDRNTWLGWPSSVGQF